MSLIAGYFPVPGTLSAAQLYELRAVGPKTEWNLVNQGPWSLYYGALDAIISNQTNYSTRGFDQYHYGPYGVSVTGTPVPQIPDKVISGTVIKANNKPWRKRVREGEIVMSNYQRFQANLTFKNGGIPQVTGPRVRKSFSSITLGAQGWMRVRMPTGNFNNAFSPDDMYSAINGSYNIEYEPRVIDVKLTPYDVGFKDAWVSQILELLDVDSDLRTQTVMKVLSEANTSAVDILTAMAEIPESVRSALNGVKECIKMFREAKRKEFSLLSKAKRVRIAHSERKAEVERLYAERKRTAARNVKLRDKLERERQREVSQLRANLRRTIKDIVDAIASVWLNFRYNIMPNVYLIEGIAKSVDDIDVLYKRYSDNVQTEFVHDLVAPGWDITSSIPVTLRVMIKRMYEKLQGYSRLLKEYSANILRTAWELVPLSFVIDWFFNVGDLLSSLLGGTQHAGFKEASVYSLKVDSTINFTHKESGASVSAHIKGYRRVKINPSAYCGLFWNPELNPVRQADAAALAWSIFAKKFSFVKRL